jgi:hypothetical protein
MPAWEVNMNCQSIPEYQDVHNERQLQSLVESLLMVLKEEIDLQQELQYSLEEERHVLQHPNSIKLHESNTTKENLLLKAMMLDRVIAEIVRKISWMTNFREQRITLSELSTFAAPPLQEELHSCRKLLASLVMNNREMNERNRDLLDMLLHLVNNSMRVIMNLVTANSDYLGTGERNQARMTGAVLCLKG